MGWKWHIQVMTLYILSIICYTCSKWIFQGSKIVCTTLDKSHASYENLFTEVRNLSNNDGPENVTFDFENAAHNSFLQTFPNTQLSLCLFHLGHNIYINILS